MRIVVVGSGVSGLVAAYVLDKAHDVTVFAADPRVGGHVHTVDVAPRGRSVPFDTGFIVFNDRTYPNFVALLGELGVRSRPGTMSFSVACEQTGLECNGGSWCGLFAQKRNAVRPRFLAMLRDIARFHGDANDYLATANESQTLADFVARRSYGTWFRERFLFPMAAAIWSADPVQIGSFPSRSMLGFLRNHGMLSATGRLIWRTIVGGSRTYVDRLRARMRARFHVGRRVVAVRRRVDGVDLATQAAPPERFDHVVLATHADQALALLADPSDVERDVLAAVRFRRNDTALHTDVALLPERRRAWAGWNYRLPSSPSADVTVTYDMNVLQGLAEPDHYLVTLNQTERIDPARVLRRLQYEHPVFDHGAVRAQRRASDALLRRVVGAWAPRGRRRERTPRRARVRARGRCWTRCRFRPARRAMTPSASCLYTGVVHHSRAEPAHAFRYRLWLVYLDLAELLQALDGGCLWSARRIALARYRRTPARPDPDADAARDVRVLLPPGDLLLLLRDGRSNADPRRRRDHEHSVAEVAGDGATLRWQFRKAFHVSPFLPMELDYDWRFTTPGERIAVRMDDRSDGRVMFDTTLAMARRPLDGRGMAAVLARHPATTVKVVAAIYWQALRLRLERAQFFAHPSSTVRGTGTP